MCSVSDEVCFVSLSRISKDVSAETTGKVKNNLALI